jgi:hypothetical protein
MKKRRTTRPTTGAPSATVRQRVAKLRSVIEMHYMESSMIAVAIVAIPFMFKI